MRSRSRFRAVSDVVAHLSRYFFHDVSELTLARAALEHAVGLPVLPETVLPDVPRDGSVEDFEQAAAAARDADRAEDEELRDAWLAMLKEQVSDSPEEDFEAAD